METPSIHPRPLPHGPGNGPYAGARADGAVLPVRYRTAVTGFNAAPEPVGKGAMITASGRVTRFAADGSSEPAAGSPMLRFSADGKTWTDVLGVTPAADGSFTVATPAVRDGFWRVELRTTGGDELPSTSGSDYVDVRYPTAIPGFNAPPEPVTKGKRLTVAGSSTYLALTGSGDYVDVR